MRHLRSEEIEINSSEVIASIAIVGSFSLTTLAGIAYYYYCYHDQSARQSSLLDGAEFIY